MQFRRLQATILLVLVSLVGCQQSTTVLPSVSSAFPVTPTGTSNPGLTPTFTSIPPTNVTASPRPTATITLTPLPTMPKDKVLAKFDQLYRYNDGCRLPCWWGITPGITTWGDARNFLKQFAEISELREDHTNSLTEKPSEFTHATFNLPDPYGLDEYGTFIDFEIQNGIVVAIKLSSYVSGWMFDWKKLYPDYGDPNRILITPHGCLQDSEGCGAVIFHMYDEERFLAQSLVSGEVVGATVSLCVFEWDGEVIYTWAPDVTIDLNFSKESDPKFIPLDEATQKQLSEFHKKSQFSGDPETCFDLTIDYWK